MWQLLIDNAAPQECCRRTGRTATKENCKAYSLVGTHTWMQCQQCKRSWTREWQRKQDEEGNWT